MPRFLLFVALISPNRMHIPPSISRRWWQVSESWISRIHFLYSLSLSFSLSLSLLSQIIIDPQSAVKSFFSSLLLSWSPVCSKRTLNPSQKCEKFKWNVNHSDFSCHYRSYAICESQSLSSCGCVSREMACCLCAGKANKPAGPRVN